MALSTPKGTSTSSDSPTTKVTSRESNKRPPHHPSKCTEEQKPDSINSVSKRDSGHVNTLSMNNNHILNIQNSQDVPCTVDPSLGL